MASYKKEPVDWITINGNHVPIFEGETKQEAAKRFITDVRNKKSVQVSGKDIEVVNSKPIDKETSDKLKQYFNEQREWARSETGVELTREEIEDYIGTDDWKYDMEQAGIDVDADTVKSNLDDLLGDKKENTTIYEPKQFDRDSFDAECKRQGVDADSRVIDDWVDSSYGNKIAGDTISEIIDNAPDDMKVGDETLYRSLWFNSKQEYQDFINSHKAGQVVETRRDGLSWTTDEEVAKVFGQESSDFYVTMVNDDDAKNAIHISNISDTPMPSSEVLYSSSTDFEVVEVEMQGDHAILYVTESPRSRQKYK